MVVETRWTMGIIFPSDLVQVAENDLRERFPEFKSLDKTTLLKQLEQYMPIYLDAVLAKKDSQQPT